MIMRMLLARETFAATPPGLEYVCISNEQFGTLYYHRETGEAKFEAPDQFVFLETQLK
eukprot:m.104367 g.104367  ORF g.104367 m.104367 type:complete len:58 (-) comp15075_c1_seq1:612-785(-)